ncbi:tetratricopeptide repeat protein [Clostridium estertheticum]|uniref:tetratricopeptide repeat protein n=1 Tax=Clostridium estertheticum TaxID=238834 RepID=UPI001CD17C89|nr:tetratricopeptide repeat protein [Clostridium estertheticum]MBZ9687146.1 tetratricopeptide repeat protein [Clostridium estertheticum]
MKAKWFKFKVLISIIIAILAIIISIRNINLKNSIVAPSNNKAEVTVSKSEEIKNDKIQDAEIKKQQVIKQKQEALEKKWKIGYDEFFKKKYVQAIETERKVLKEDSNFYKAYAVEGIALAYSGNFKSGLEQIDQALKLKPDYGYARFNKALANELYGHYDEAIKWYKSALEVEKFEWSYYGIASIYGRKGDIENSIKYLKLAIDINPTIKNTAKDEEDFDNVQDSIEFKELIK